MFDQPVASVRRIATKPASRRAEAKTVSPSIHVAHQSLGIKVGELLGQHDLQVADRGLFQVIAAGVAHEASPAIAGHAYDVRELV